MKSFAINKQNDLYIASDGKLALCYDLQAVLNLCQHSVQTLRGEMIYAMDRGLPSLQNLSHNMPKLAVLEWTIRSALNKVPGVENVENFTLQHKGDHIQYSASIKTIYGKATFYG